MMKNSNYFTASQWQKIVRIHYLTLTASLSAANTTEKAIINMQNQWLLFLFWVHPKPKQVMNYNDDHIGYLLAPPLYRTTQCLQNTPTTTINVCVGASIVTGARTENLDSSDGRKHHLSNMATYIIILFDFTTSRANLIKVRYIMLNPKEFSDESKWKIYYTTEYVKSTTTIECINAHFYYVWGKWQHTISYSKIKFR